MFFFSPIVNKKDRRANFLIIRFNAPGFFCMYAVNAKQEINLIWPNQNLLVRALKSKFSPSSVYFSNWYFSLYIEQPKKFLLSLKQLYMLLWFLSHVLCSTLIDWWIFTREKIWLICLNSHITLRNIVNSSR